MTKLSEVPEKIVLEKSNQCTGSRGRLLTMKPCATSVLLVAVLYLSAIAGQEESNPEESTTPTPEEPWVFPLPTTPTPTPVPTPTPTPSPSPSATSPVLPPSPPLPPARIPRVQPPVYSPPQNPVLPAPDDSFNEAHIVILAFFSVILAAGIAAAAYRYCYEKPLGTVKQVV